ncbi:MAG: hypothetical protein MO846_05985 [Candidatus Devosia symbiotica]|nr:hypothetical protein [Candidatus Devosia symbiotica]
MLGAFENFYFAGHFVTNRQMMDAIILAWDEPLKVTPLPWLMLHAMDLVNGDDARDRQDALSLE